MSTADGPMAQLRELKRLCDEGVISPQEFEAKKQELLAMPWFSQTQAASSGIEQGDGSDQGSSSSRGPIETGSIALAGSAIFLNAALLVAILTTRGGFRKIFDDFDTTLPPLTLLAQGTGLIGLVGTLLGLLIIKEFLIGNRTAKVTCNTIGIFVVLLLGAIYTIAMFLPLVALIQKLGGGG